MSTEHERVARIVNATEEERAELQRVAASMAPALPDFLLARYAEDEATSDELVHEEVARCRADGMPGTTEDEIRAFWGGQAWWRRRLADADSKRRIVAWHRLIDGLDTEDNPVRGCGNCIASGAEPPYIIGGPCMTLRLLALPYADHDGYDPAWRP